jgi:hypothetical protein
MDPMGTEAFSRGRIALNQSRFRRANEKIEATAETMALLEWVPFICEGAAGVPNRRCGTDTGPLGRHDPAPVERTSSGVAPVSALRRRRSRRRAFPARAIPYFP